MVSKFWKNVSFKVEGKMATKALPSLASFLKQSGLERIKGSRTYHAVLIDNGLDGGGKRARSAGAKARVSEQSKEMRMAELRDIAGTTGMKIGAKRNMSNTVNSVMLNLVAATQEMDEAPEEVVTNALYKLPVKDLKKLHTALTSTNNVELRRDTTAKSFFGPSFNMLQDLKNLIAETEKAIKDEALMLLTSEFGDDTGAVQWATYCDKILEVIVEKSKETGRAEAIQEAMAIVEEEG